MIKFIYIFISFFFISAIEIKKEKMIEIDTEKLQRYSEKHGIWIDNEFDDSDITEEKFLIKYNKKYIFPMNIEIKINSGFGQAINRTHYGVDYDCKEGTIIFSSSDGTVIEKGYKYNLGNYIVIEYADFVRFTYAHLSKIYVKEDDYVEIGQIIGRSGNSGHSTGPHLHLEVSYQNIFMNPSLFFD